MDFPLTKNPKCHAKSDPWGCMAGPVTIMPGVDLTAPSELWNAEARREPTKPDGSSEP
jgi:hypothetical protein